MCIYQRVKCMYFFGIIFPAKLKISMGSTFESEKLTAAVANDWIRNPIGEKWMHLRKQQI